MFFLPKKGPMAAVVFILRPQSQAFIKPLYCQMDNECFVVLCLWPTHGSNIVFLPKNKAFTLSEMTVRWPYRPDGTDIRLTRIK